MEAGQMTNILVSHFEDILAIANHHEVGPIDLSHFSTTGKLNSEEASSLGRHLEVDEVLRSIKEGTHHKAPGPDRFNSFFYKVC